MDTTEYRATYREYASTIYELAEQGLPAIQARVADWLGVSRASVSEMIHRMVDDGLVLMNDELELTEEGRQLAEVVVRRHRLAERFLTEVLGLPWVKVHREAEVWEHTISEDVEAAIWKVLDNPQTCPHGNPIPGSGYVPPAVKPISEMELGEVAALERIAEELEFEAETLDFLDQAGLRPPLRIKLVGKAPRDAFTVEAEGYDAVGIGTYVADRVFVVAK